MDGASASCNHVDSYYACTGVPFELQVDINYESQVTLSTENIFNKYGVQAGDLLLDLVDSDDYHVILVLGLRKDRPSHGPVVVRFTYDSSPFCYDPHRFKMHLASGQLKPVFSFVTMDVQSDRVISSKYKAPCFMNLVNNPIFADVQFQCNDGALVHASRGIISQRSEYFAAMFGQQRHLKTVESSASTIVLDMDEVTCVSIMEYLYTGETSVTIHNAHPLLKAADLLLLFDLTNDIIRILVCQLLPTNVLDMYILAGEFKIPTLKIACQKMIVSESKESAFQSKFIKEFASIHPDLFAEVYSYMIEGTKKRKTIPND